MSAAILTEIRQGFYLDSVALMRLSRAIADLPGIEEAALMMGSPSNKRIMEDARLLDLGGRDAQSNDLIIGVRAVNGEAAKAALDEAKRLLEMPRGAAGAAETWRPRSLRAAVEALPEANLALISVPGDFAAGEARKALRRGLHVMIFSDNVALEDELSLKQEARGLGLLVMGPDCGTAIIGGVPLAFANRVPRGDIGIVGASGTGIQEVSCLIARHGGGISQAIGTGGRDLRDSIGGITTLMAIDALDRDPETRHIVLISKPPSPSVAERIAARLAQSAKPFTVCYIGAQELDLPANARFAPTLEAAALDALGGQEIEPDPAGIAADARPGTVCGLYAGGTLCAEAQIVLMGGGRKVASNAPVRGARTLDQAEAGVDRIFDLGADEYTQGRPHPMIEPAIRDLPLRAALADAELSVVLLDVVIGQGAHADPAGHLAAVLAQRPTEGPLVVASVTGTEEDPQVRSRQVATLARAGVRIASSNARAAALALALRTASA